MAFFNKHKAFEKSQHTMLEKRLRVQKPPYIQVYRETDPAVIAALREIFIKKAAHANSEYARKTYAAAMLKHLNVLGALHAAEQALAEKATEAFVLFGERYPRFFHELTQETTVDNVTAKIALGDYLQTAHEGKYTTNLKMRDHSGRLYKEAALMAATLDDEKTCATALSGYHTLCESMKTVLYWVEQAPNDAMIAAALIMRCDEKEDALRVDLLRKKDEKTQMRIVRRITASRDDWTSPRARMLLNYLKAAQENDATCNAAHIETVKILIDPQRFGFLEPEAAENFGPSVVAMFYDLILRQMQRGTQEVMDVLLPTMGASDRFLQGYDRFRKEHQGDHRNITWENLMGEADSMSGRMALHIAQQIYDSHLEIRNKLKKNFTLADSKKLDEQAMLMVPLVYKALYCLPDEEAEAEACCLLAVEIVCLENENKIVDYVHGDDTAMPENGAMLEAIRALPEERQAKLNKKIATYWYGLLTYGTGKTPRTPKNDAFNF